MSVTRKEFLRKACISGACLCGVAPAVLASPAHTDQGLSDQTAKNPNELQQEWISILLDSIDDRFSEDELREILKGCALSHYNKMSMSTIIEPYRGKPDEFISFLEKEWHWKIEYDKNTGTIIADENKDYCVCPMVNREKGIRSDSICLCSEGFIEKMFSEVLQRPVVSRVINSVLRGDPTCRYRVSIT